MTYGASADFDTLKESGAIEASTNTRSQATGEVLRLMVDEFWRLQRERVGERELSDAKAYLTGSFPLTIETPDAIATQVLNVLFYGLPVEQLESFRQRVNAVSVDDVERVSKYFLRPDRLAIVLVGNAAEFTPQLRRAGFGAFEVIDMNDLDLTAGDFKRAPRRGAQNGSSFSVLRASFSQASTQNPAPRTQNPAVNRRTQNPPASAQNDARELIDRAIAAKGGLERLRAIKHHRGHRGADEVRPKARSLPRRPPTSVSDRMRVETKLPEGDIVRRSTALARG